MPVLGLAVQDGGVVGLGIEGLGVEGGPVEAGFLPHGRPALVDEAGGCVCGEELGEVEAVGLRGGGGGGEG